jgi:hypothetical protein
MSGNRLPPAELAQLSALAGLTELNLSCGGLFQAPRVLAALTRLRKLNLSCNMLPALAPGSMDTLTSLESLNLAHNRWGRGGRPAAPLPRAPCPAQRYGCAVPRANSPRPVPTRPAQV